MAIWFGWLGALLVVLASCFGAERAPACKQLALLIGALLLGVYAATRDDYPLVVLIGFGIAWGLVSYWRGLRLQRRARSVDVTLDCDGFERARRAMKESLRTPS